MTAALGVALLGGSVYAAPAFAQTDTTTTTTSQTTTSSSDMAQKMEAHVETRIKTLHDELKITPDQESQWNTVAQTMRENESTLAPLYEARKNASSMNAIDNLKSHQALSQAYAEAFGKFVTAFEPLYQGMSDTQKKWADESFAKEDSHMHKAMMQKTKVKTSKTTTTGSGQ
jgi:hypothetical protein